MQLKTKCPPFSPEDFCLVLAAQLVLLNRQRIPLGDPRVEEKFAAMVTDLRRRALEAFPRDEDFAHSILNILESISPNPNTGAFDELWSLFRRLQPAPINVRNPLYGALEIGFTRDHAEAELEKAPEAWREIVRSSADRIASVL
ncbi:MAG: hypothetical protein AABZ30_09340 [Myxococcota bacterium]